VPARLVWRWTSSGFSPWSTDIELLEIRGVLARAESTTTIKQHDAVIVGRVLAERFGRAFPLSDIAPSDDGLRAAVARSIISP